MILYVNNRHAGHGFVLRHLLKDLKIVDLASMHHPGAWEVVHTHLFETTYDAVRRAMPFVKGAFTTFRSGLEESHLKRGESLWMLAREKTLMLDLMAEFEVLPLHLELPDVRDRELAEINRRFGLSLITDWVRVPSMDSEMGAFRSSPDNIRQYRGAA